MATIYFNQRQLVAKVVYYGGAGAGCNTNVRTLYGLVAARDKGRLHAFGASDAEQSLFFEYTPTQILVPGFVKRIRVYSLPGGVESLAHRQEAFRDVDGIILVLDARPERRGVNAEGFAALAASLQIQGKSIASLPLVVQVNHLDAPDARSAADVVGELGLTANPVISGVAKSSRGVIEAHERIISDLATRLRDNLAGKIDAIPMAAAEGSPESDEDTVARHVAVLEIAENPSRTFPELNVVDFRMAMQKRYKSLEPGPKFEVPFQPREFASTRPVHVLDAYLAGDQVVVELVIERLAGGEPKRLSLQLVNRPMDATPVPRHVTNTSPTHTSPAVVARPISDIPEKFELPTPEAADFPPVWYGVAGLAGGMLVGVLVGFLAFG